MFDLNHPRRNAIDAMKASIGAYEWTRNVEFTKTLKARVQGHRVASHPAIEALSGGRFDKVQLKIVHLEYRHAIVQIFTDALLAAQLETRQLEARLAPASKMPPRFLLTLNDLDEFGFRPGADSEGYYLGNPKYAHYPLFEAVLADYGISAEERDAYRPTAIAATTRRALEEAYADYPRLSATLAVAEEEVILYSPALRRATAAVGLPVSTGYYHVHGASTDDAADAADDAHEDDLWLVTAQGITPDRYDDIAARAMAYCDVWALFWDCQLSLLDARSS
jgi:hypothetical protein